MGSGVSGLYSGVYTGSAFGSIDYMKPTDDFSKFIKKRKDIDVNGFYDIIAHGSFQTIEIQHNGKAITIDHRIAAKLFRQNPESKGKAIRLLSCSTGAIDSGFAQNLANKLNVPVKAPTDILWVLPNGRYFVAAGKMVDGKLQPISSKQGKFKIYYPKRRKQL